jgi:uncharacterized protein (DUF362 family)
MAKVFIGKVNQDLAAQLRAGLDYVEWEKIVPRGARVFFKPNLTYPIQKFGVTTTPEFVEAVLQIFSERTSNLYVGESDGGYQGWPAETAFRSHHLPEICARYGARLVNLSREPRTTVEMNLSRGQVSLDLPALLVNEMDLFVTLPVPKIHQVTLMSGAIKNQWGCIPDNMRLVHHPHFDEMILEINRVVKTRLALADGTFFLNRTGPMFGDAVPMNLAFVADNIGALDWSLCRIMGLDWKQVRHLGVARDKGWVPAPEQIEYSQPLEPFTSQLFYLRQTPRSSIVRWAFDRPWAIRLFWNSWFADQFHKVLYGIAGNQVHSDRNKS